MYKPIEEIGTSILEPLFDAFAVASHWRVRSYMSDAITLPVPVCSIGNVTFGGTAKTPMVQLLAQILAHSGLKPGVVLRGWKGQIDRRNGPPALVSDGKTTFTEWTQCGDEARLLADSLRPLSIPVAVGRDRVKACRLLMERAKVDLILLDDAFQYTGLARDADIVLIDTLCPFGRLDGGFGLLREPISSLSRSDAVVLTRVEAVPKEKVRRLKSTLIDRVKNLPEIYSARTTVHAVREGGGDTGEFPFALQGSRVLALSGIANPLGFKYTLEELGCDIAGTAIFPDHHPFRKSEIEKINRRARQLEVDTVVTTTKDAIRLNGLRKYLTVPLCVVEIRLAIDDGPRFLNFLFDRIRLKSGTGR